MRIYIACLASYNNGRLHGEWIEASSDVDEMQVAISRILRASPYPNVEVECVECDGSGVNYDYEGGGSAHCRVCTVTGMVPSAEEWAVHDYEDFPQMGEYPSLADIAAYVDLVDAHTNFDEDEVKAVVNNCNGDLATASEMLSDKHCGSYNCFRDYSDEAADEMMSFHEGVPECISNYFDYESWERDLKMDMTVIDTPYGVMVFHA